MEKNRDLVGVLRAKKMRITPARRVLLQFVLNHKRQYFSLSEITDHLEAKIPGIDRSSIYRNIETLKRLEIIQELNLPKMGKRFQYIFDKPVHHYFICRRCGKLNRGHKSLFVKIEKALKDIPDFSNANLSVVFYGACKKCLPLPHSHSNARILH